MRKNLFLLLIAVMAAIHVCAQEVEIATLQNGDDVQLFFGHDAFIDAMDAAESGGVITLSPGTFNATDITKPVTIYGSGYETKADSLSVAEGKALYPSILNGKFRIALDSLEQEEENLYIEGIYFPNEISVPQYLKNATFIKCRFYELKFTVSKNCFISQCRMIALEPNTPITMKCSNSIVGILRGTTDKSSLLLQNSIIVNISVKEIRAVFKNCIALEKSIENFNKNCSAYNSFFASEECLNSVITQDGNWIDDKCSIILFGRDKISYNDTSTYELTEEAKKIYLGTDGTQIGIYGGSQPFSTKLTIPRVVKRNIAGKTEAGKLKVNIEVESGDESF